jgi:hypothetical protein
MDSQEFLRRTELVRARLGDEDLFREIEQEVRQDERVQAMADNIKQLRLAHGVASAEQELVSINRDLIDEVRVEILAQHGIQMDIEKLQEEAEARRIERIKNIHDQLRGDESDSELLRAFRLTDEDGQFNDKTAESPLFKPRTQMAFDSYRSAVGTFQVLVDYNQAFGVPSKNVGRADALRREAHDEVAREVAEDLGLDFDVARRLVEKIRDGVMPGSGEQSTYAKAGLRAGRRLEKLYGNDVAGAVEDKLSPIFESRDNNDEAS